jgi:hypothetical protein
VREAGPPDLALNTLTGSIFDRPTGTFRALLLAVSVTIAPNGHRRTDECSQGDVLGLASLVVAAAAVGVWLTTNRPVVVRVLAGILGVVLMFVLFAAFDAVLSPLASDGHWFQQEVEIVAAALVGIALAWAARPVASKDDITSSRPPAMSD